MNVINRFCQVSPNDYSLAAGFVHLGAGLACGLTGLSAGYAIGYVGDSVSVFYITSVPPTPLKFLPFLSSVRSRFGE